MRNNYFISNHAFWLCAHVHMIKFNLIYVQPKWRINVILVIVFLCPLYDLQIIFYYWDILHYLSHNNRCKRLKYQRTHKISNKINVLVSNKHARILRMLKSKSRYDNINNSFYRFRYFYLSDVVIIFHVTLLDFTERGREKSEKIVSCTKIYRH